MSYIEIFKVGKQTSNNGTAIDFTADVLRQAADTYNAKVAADGDSAMAPMVIGHPQSDEAPAYGWIKSLKFNEATGKLLAEATQVDEGLKAVVNKGHYKKVSASFYTPDAPSNPAQGSFFLRHLGFLGAQAPAVKGLKAVHFASADEGVVEFSEYDDVVNASLWRNLREWILGKFSREDADQAVPGFEVSSLETSAVQEVIDEQKEEKTEDFSKSSLADATQMGAPASYAENNEKQSQTTTVTQAATTTAQTADFAEQQAALDARSAALAEQAAALAAKEAKFKAQEAESFCEGLIGEGKLLPALKSQALVLFSAFDASGATVDFAEGTKPAAELFREFLGALPKQVSFSEIAKPEQPRKADTMNFAVAPGYTVNTEQLEQLSRAKAYMAEHNVDLSTALKNI